MFLYWMNTQTKVVVVVPKTISNNRSQNQDPFALLHSYTVTNSITQSVPSPTMKPKPDTHSVDDQSCMPFHRWSTKQQQWWPRPQGRSHVAEHNVTIQLDLKAVVGRQQPERQRHGPWGRGRRQSASGGGQGGVGSDGDTVAHVGRHAASGTLNQRRSARRPGTHHRISAPAIGACGHSRQPFCVLPWSMASLARRRQIEVISLSWKCKMGIGLGTLLKVQNSYAIAKFDSNMGLGLTDGDSLS
jgi:hypothetical protein